MDTRFDHKSVEDKIYGLWEKSGFFNPDKLPGKRKKVFTIIMPPPNANGPLHMGHAFEVSIQDLLIRFERMRGRRTLWLPGADHAGFETQVVFDKKLEKEGRNRFEIDRDKLWKEIWDFTQTNKKTMEGQLRKLGASCDWSRKKFTLDEDVVKKTQKSFVELYKAGLIYRGIRVVNWCTKHQTAFSDLETKDLERKDSLYYIKYGPLTLATVRPETKFGDTAIAVHPKDKRYQKYVGLEIEFETLLGKAKMKVIADERVDPDFGTGVIKVTPAHDPLDFEIGMKHGLEVRQVIDKYGRLNEKTGPYQGMKIMEARAKVVEDMKARSLIEKVDEDYTHNVKVCYKCGTIIEPLPLPQWWIKMEPLAKPAIEVVEKNQIRFMPPRFKKTYLHWLKNIRDWNLSRQIVWGIRIPAWFCKEMRNERCKKENGLIVATMPPKKCPRCEGEIEQDPDVFDTWFSSGQWPFLTLGFPDSKDYKAFYPTDVMDPGYEILFFWVARMIMLGIYRTGKIPFRTVYLHGMVRDKDRQKMSKSKGNVIDPLGVAETYGTDAVRIALISGNAPGNDPVISEEKIRGYRNFVTKIWNLSRFIIMNAKEAESKNVKYSGRDLHHLKKLESVKKSVTKNLEQFKFHLAAETIYHYTWHEVADKIIEESKPRLQGNDTADRKAAAATLLKILEESLKMLHPFMPFVTEKIWNSIPNSDGLLMVQEW
ncbi:MAG: valine--tRNA ligase [Candidatus Colwellbacteria bacterium]|nr:valine--tRNA ligase [Candidatus Colwellbacteria bacterium]